MGVHLLVLERFEKSQNSHASCLYQFTPDMLPKDLKNAKKTKQARTRPIPRGLWLVEIESVP